MIFKEFIDHLPDVAGEVGMALLPVVAMIIVFQFVFLNLPVRQLLRTAVGLVYTYVGLVIFLLGVNVGFQPAGTEIGRTIGAGDHAWLLLIIGALLGCAIVFAEPAVRVLMQQVEKVSGGTIHGNMLLFTLSGSVALAIVLGMVRVLTGLSLWWFIVPGYAAALILMKFAPPVFTAIAFDSGGVSSGPMTATFLLPMAVGAAEGVAGSNPITDAFGMVALVAMMPPIAIQLLGILHARKVARSEEAEAIDLALLDDTDLLDEELESLEGVAALPAAPSPSAATAVQQMPLKLEGEDDDVNSLNEGVPGGESPPGELLPGELRDQGADAQTENQKEDG